MKLLKVLVDEKPVKVELGYTVMQTCAQVGIEIPRFCYHDKLLIAGNCRICLVEVVGSKKLVASCAVHSTDNMVIFTNTVRVRLARQHVLEFLLANHPLDCPICDQGGECDLQDIASVFGADRGRFYEFEKRAVLNKDFGPLIRTSMNRCIHCTRCVRFLAHTSGSAVLGTLGRGASTEISLYINSFISDELSGNITDLCPVGALTSKPYSFQARPWELVSVESVDVFDSFNSTMVVDIFANKISRILPYANEQINECWLSNRARYAYDGLFVQRLSMCLLKVHFKFLSSDILAPCVLFSQFYIKLSWASAVSVFFSKLLNDRIIHFSAAIGGLLDLEAVIGAKVLFERLGALATTEFESSSYASDFTFLYLFNTSVVKLAKLPTFCLLVGVNLRLDAPVLNLRLSALVNQFDVPVYRIGGSPNFFSFKTKYLSNNMQSFFNIMEFKHEFCKNFYIPVFYGFPFILIGNTAVSSFCEQFFVGSILNFLGILGRLIPVTFLSSLESFSFFGFLHSYSGRIHTHDAGFCPSTVFVTGKDIYGSADRAPAIGCRSAILYSLGFDSFGLQELSTLLPGSNAWIIYQGTHGHGVAGLANLIFPATTHVESSVCFKNLIGYVSKTNVAVSYNFDAKSNIEIFRLLSAKIFLRAFQFSRLNFKFSVQFNWNLLINYEMLVSSHFLTPWRNSLRKNWDSVGVNMGAYSWLYRTFLKLDCLTDSWAFQVDFYKQLVSQEGVAFAGYTILTARCVNYYADSSVVLLTASKTMSLCSTLFLKKNLSLPSIYF